MLLLYIVKNPHTNKNKQNQKTPKNLEQEMKIIHLINTTDGIKQLQYNYSKWNVV